MADIGSALYIQFLNAQPPFEYLFYLQTFRFKWLNQLLAQQYNYERNKDHLFKNNTNPFPRFSFRLLQNLQVFKIDSFYVGLRKALMVISFAWMHNE